MPLVTMRHDLRAPDFAGLTLGEVYDTALAQWRWADEHGWDFAVLSEHHGVDDGWLPAPLTMAGVLLGATSRITVLVSALVLTLHDPIRVAEQLAVLDNVAPGRLWVVAGTGYRREEFEMAGLDMRDRGRRLEAHLRAILTAWSGEPFEHDGRTVRVTPTPRGTPMVLVGGGVEAAARRAARLRLPMLPMRDDPRLAEWYAEEAASVGFEDGMVLAPQGPTFVHVTTDPERAWARLAPHLLYEARTYASYQTPGQHSAALVAATTEEELRASPNVWVGTPDDIVARAAALPPTAALTFNPLAGGIPPDVAWESLELFEDQVRPRLG